MTEIEILRMEISRLRERVAVLESVRSNSHPQYLRQPIQIGQQHMRPNEVVLGPIQTGNF